ncbi:alternative ribosome rescue aminoacyl-tRNA hydrolase ArfB [Flaviflexus massiliensis]|uniref:alternative ribosome rescue aminoacyl-tRNA hydrolase ArfB n=1 Tax=Flaviflexus massiliensis TaxID=1522309 RepID=UPI0006D541D9|nr:alternative ribosome rescue aminoacyl-tRNA hydrolase ArfB [Flaviflexus massiliensis]
MKDLVVPPGPGAPNGLTIPARELVEQFSHGSGPGGQSVNTSDSRVQLSLNLATTVALTDVQRSRLLLFLAPRMNEGVLTVTAAEHRSQHRNRMTARERLAELIREAIMPPVPRRPTNPTRASKRRHIEAKKHRSQIKLNRRKPHRDQ